ncbi:unnamed protein product [Haemonchus placei]|uniref:IgGFc_binding domain-containing protein n=1 Tax=Haemonchus placei TaxID=6290 RepID=A0A0N4WIX5_HAEPC|nr:unnamed protein product [Haemonchus placei]
MALRLLLPFLLAIDVAAEPSIGIRHGRISELPRHLQLAKMNAVPLSAAATTIAQGTSFVYSYLNSHLNAKDTSYTENLALSITNPTDQIASVTVAITPADIQTDYMDQYLQYAVIETKVLFVDSNVTISLIASNSLTAGGGEDKFVVLPICQLGLEYHVVGDESSHVFQSYQSTNIITIIATQDQTTVQMNYLYTAPTVLNRGEQLTIATYYTQTTVAVSSDKPVAVISGSVCGYGYYNPSHCSYEVLMLAPSSNWAKDAAYYKFQPEDIGEFMVLFEKENTVVYLDEVQVDGGPFGHDSYLIVGTRTGSYVRANGPIYVVAVGSSNSQNQGAPFFANVPSSSSFSQGPFTFSMGRSNSYFVDVAVKGGKHTVSFVGADTPWAPITFGVTVYGYGLNRGYAFTPGLSYQGE